MARKRIVILGGGTGGTMVANRLSRRFDADDAEIHVVDQDTRHVYQPGLLFVPFGLTSLDEIVRPRTRQLRNGIVFHERKIDAVWIERDELLLDDGTILPYDVLVVATGSRLQPEETEGLTGPGWNERAFTFYSPEGAAALATALERFDGGRVVVNLVDMPEEIESDVEVIATGRSDYPNQINNVLAFPGVFRGALDVRASEITKEMEVAAARAIASVVKPDELEADYIVPSVFHPDLATTVAAAVRQSVESGAT